MQQLLKKWTLFSDQKPARWLAIVLSEAANPLFVALPTFLLIAWVTAPDMLHALLWWMISVLGISVAPFLFILRGVRKGRYSDHHVSNREQRLVPLLFGVSCMAISFVLLLALGVSRPLMATVTAVLVACSLSLLITTWWKISLHLVGIAGAVTVFVLLFGPRLLILSPLVFLVGWARWYVRAHSLMQTIAGTALAVGVTVTLFWLFGVH